VKPHHQPAANTVSNQETIDVIIIGGGIIGCYTAYYLLQRGVRVRIVERDSIGAGASTGNCGYICPSHVMPLCVPGAITHTLPKLLTGRGAISMAMRFDPKLWNWLFQFSRHCLESPKTHAAAARHELLRSSMSLYREFISEHPSDCQWHDAGLMIVHRGQRTWDAFQKTADELAARYDIHPRRLDPEQLQQREPTLVEELAGGWIFDGDSHLHPGQLMRCLQDRLQNSGCEIVEDTEVLGLNIDKGKISSISTSHGEMHAEQYVIASGAESPRFAKPLGCAIPIVPGKGLSMTFSSLAGAPRQPMIFDDTHVAVTPWGERVRVGSTMRFAGYDKSLDAKRMQMIRDSAQSYLRIPLPRQPEAPWAGWRPMVYDDLPCIDRAPKVENAMVAAGHGMIGLSTATGTGKLIAQMMTGESTHIDPSPYSLKRF
jgi:D-amino-acid dehydrogenase